MCGNACALTTNGGRRRTKCEREEARLDWAARWIQDQHQHGPPFPVPAPLSETGDEARMLGRREWKGIRRCDDTAVPLHARFLSAAATANTAFYTKPPQSALTKKQSSKTLKSKEHQTIKKQTRTQEAKPSPHSDCTTPAASDVSTQRSGDSAFGRSEPCIQLLPRRFFFFHISWSLVPRGALHSSVPGPAEPSVSQQKDFPDKPCMGPCREVQILGVTFHMRDAGGHIR